jgi:ankyrin repeat protein
MNVIEAIRAGDLEALKRAVASDPAAVGAKADGGIPAALFAAYCRRPDFAQALIDAGVRVDLPTACALGRTETAAAILDAHPELVHARTADGWTPLHLAAFFGQVETARLLIARKAGVHARSANSNANLPLHAAAAGRHSAIVEMLLQAGSDVNAVQEEGFTALHSAAQSGDAATMEVLLRYGADLHKPADDGRTPADLMPGRDA